jgi:hypothetical protein
VILSAGHLSADAKSALTDGITGMHWRYAGAYLNGRSRECGGNATQPLGSAPPRCDNCGMDETDIRVIIDALLEARKVMIGLGDWFATDRDGQLRWSRPLQDASSGEITGLELIADAYPREPEATFKLVLKHGIAVSRVDYGPYESHLNKGDPLRGVTRGLIIGPHAHLWCDNRPRRPTMALPRELDVAQLLPAKVQGFENAFRWFCGENGIFIRGGDLPTFPRSDTLL